MHRGLSEIMGKRHDVVYDRNGNEIGTVREHVFNVAMPFLEKVRIE